MIISILLILLNVESRSIPDFQFTRAVCRVKLSVSQEEYDSTIPIKLSLGDSSRKPERFPEIEYLSQTSPGITWVGKLGQVAPSSNTKEIFLLLHTPVIHNRLRKSVKDSWTCNLDFSTRFSMQVQVSTEKFSKILRENSRKFPRNRTIINPDRTEIICRADQLQIFIEHDQRCLHGAICVNVRTGIQTCSCKNGYKGANCREMIWLRIAFFSCWRLFYYVFDMKDITRFGKNVNALKSHFLSVKT